MSAETENHNIEEQTTCIDWLTVTAKGIEIRRELLESVSWYIADLESAGYEKKGWHFKGYDGVQCGSFRYGSRTDSDIIMLSGAIAQINGLDILKQCPNPTRIDLALTVTLVDPIVDFAKSCYEQLIEEESKKGLRKRKLTLFTNNNGGQTLYIGSRFSDQLGRIYDKGREVSGKGGVEIPMGKIWRAEVEFKSYRAKRVGFGLLESLKENDDIPAMIGATVNKWFLSRGVLLISNAYEDLPYLTEISATITDDEKKIKWLSTQVSPSVQYLISKGKGAEVLAALGLDGLTD